MQGGYLFLLQTNKKHKNLEYPSNLPWLAIIKKIRRNFPTCLTMIFHIICSNSIKIHILKKTRSGGRQWLFRSLVFYDTSLGMKKFLDLTKGQLKAAGHCRMNDQWASSFFTTGIWVNVFPSFLRDFFQQIRYCPFVPRGQWHHFYSSFVPQTPSTKKPT